jgi:hypothetical protein
LLEERKTIKKERKKERDKEMHAFDAYAYMHG